MTRTIVAVATPPGIGGLSVIRISGSKSFEILMSCFVPNRKINFDKSGRIYYGKLIHKGQLIDFVTASIFIAPNSYTGENTVEIGCHGSNILASKIVDIIVECGGAYAEAGEFTKRAFLNGKLDLLQAEAVADLIHSVSTAGMETSAKQLEGKYNYKLREIRQHLLDVSSLLELELDFADEGIPLVSKSEILAKLDEIKKYCISLLDTFTASEICRAGFYVGIAGYPNSGKSTLFNALVGRERAIVSNISGTTRDYLEDSIYINGLKIIIADTAGLRETSDIIEIEGIKLAESVIEKSNMVIILNDSSITAGNSDQLAKNLSDRYKSKIIAVIQNKIDISNLSFENVLAVSAKNLIGINKVKDFIYKHAAESITGLSDIMINTRHRQLLTEAEKSINSAIISIKDEMENEVIAIDLRNATKILGELTGESWNEEVLANIFSRFCIGK